MVRYFCDRCGKEEYNFYRVRIDTPNHCMKLYDLCEECAIFLFSWFKNEEEKEEVNEK